MDETRTGGAVEEAGAGGDPGAGAETGEEGMGGDQCGWTSMDHPPGLTTESSWRTSAPESAGRI